MLSFDFKGELMGYQRRGHDGVMMWWWWLEWCVGCVDRGGWSVGLGVDREEIGAEKRKEEEKKIIRKIKDEEEKKKITKR